MTYVLFGVKQGEPDYMEEYITETDDKIKAKQEIEKSEQNGFSKVRVLTISGNEKPDFLGSISFQAINKMQILTVTVIKNKTTEILQ